MAKYITKKKNARSKRPKKSKKLIRRARAKRISKKKIVAKSKKLLAKKKKILSKKSSSKKSTKKKSSFKKPSKKVTRKKKISKKTSKKVTKKPSKKKLQHEISTLESQLKKLRKAQKDARNEPKKSVVRKKLRTRKKAIADRRTERALVLQNLPHKTKREEERSKEDIWDRMRGRFRSLLEYAEKSGQTPKTRRIPRKVNSRINEGEQRIVRIRRVVTDNSVEPILYKIERVIQSLKGGFRLWYSLLSFSGLGERLFGSGNRTLEMPKNELDLDSMFFQSEGYENTGIWNSYQSMLQKIRDILEDYASSKRTIIYLHHVKVMNFNRKSKA